MNHDFKNQMNNAAIKAKYGDHKIAEAVEQMSTQRQADVFCAEAGHHLQAMKGAVVFDEHVVGRYRRLVVTVVLIGLLSLSPIYAVWPELRAVDGISVVAAAWAAAGVLGLLLASILGWAAWRVRSRSPYPDVSADQVRRAHALQEVIGEKHKQPPGPWERSILGFGNLLECAAFAYMALLGLAMLPPNIAALAALFLGVAITGAVAMLGRLHAQRTVVLNGREMYRRVAQLARELKAAGDSQAEKYGAHAEALREALAPANMGQFAAPSTVKIAFLWIALASLVGLALALRVAFGSAVGAGGLIGAVMLAIGTCVIFVANYRLAERHLSVAGDSGQRAMRISAAFPSVETLTAAVDRHAAQSELFFHRVMATAAQCHEAKLDLQDPKRPRITLDFRIPAGAPDPADGPRVPGPVNTGATEAKAQSTPTGPDFSRTWARLRPSVAMQPRNGADRGLS